jgi:N-acetylglucosaminyldiphosphoundecaprenol N-acetyl-beta-D-mannosaminyltransferase
MTREPGAQVFLFGAAIDAVTREQALDRLEAWLGGSTTGRYVVTPNVDHVVKLDRDDAFRRAYRDASLVVVDGTPVRWAARLLRQPLPEVITGSDLTPALFDRIQRRGHSLRLFLLGAGPGVAERAGERIAERWPAIQVCGVHSPPQGFERDPEAGERILQLLNDARPDLLVVGLGAPKQELWAHRMQAKNPARVTLCVGATIDFLAGQVQRAPAWLHGTGLEWLYRLAREPSRLGPRYLGDALRFPRIVWRAYRGGSRAAESRH